MTIAFAFLQQRKKALSFLNYFGKTSALLFKI